MSTFCKSLAALALVLLALPAVANAALDFRFTTGTLGGGATSSMARLILDSGACTIDFSPASSGNSVTVYTSTCTPGAFSSVTLEALSTDGWYISKAEVNEGSGWVTLETTPDGHRAVWLDDEPYNSDTSDYFGKPYSSSWTFIETIPDVTASYRFTTGTITYASSNGTFQLSVDNGSCKKNFSAPSPGNSKTVSLTCPGGTPMLPAKVKSFTTNGWFIDEAEADTGSGFSLLSPDEVWADKPPFNAPSAYSGYPYAEVTTFN